MRALKSNFFQFNYFLLAAAVMLLFIVSPILQAANITVAGPKLEPKKGRFLVATDNLAHTSFKNTVILMTHVSTAYGAQGITINRPANIPIADAFPHIKELKKRKDSIYLGGPVHTGSVFVLLQTQNPEEGMQKIIDDLYFSVGVSAFTNGTPKTADGDIIRAYAGYAGWAPGQLQNEIKRGDWIIVEANTKIVFDDDTADIWEKLHNSWAGNWI